GRLTKLWLTPPPRRPKINRKAAGLKYLADRKGTGVIQVALQYGDVMLCTIISHDHELRKL
ncbi:MAG: hypothetical protein ABSC26_10440, partial [Stellaceae bacterium]